jgi:hypothetical protein
MAIHPGDANRRLASEISAIMKIPPYALPAKYQRGFNQLQQLIEETVRRLPEPELRPTHLGRIQNRTAVRFIKMLIALEYDLKNDTEIQN